LIFFDIFLNVPLRRKKKSTQHALLLRRCLFLLYFVLCVCGNCFCGISPRRVLAALFPSACPPTRIIHNPPTHTHTHTLVLHPFSSILFSFFFLHEEAPICICSGASRGTMLYSPCEVVVGDVTGLCYPTLLFFFFFCLLLHVYLPLPFQLPALPPLPRLLDNKSSPLFKSRLPSN